MGRIKKVSIILTALILYAGASFSQFDPNWNASFIFNPFPKPYLSEWERDPSIGSLTLFYMGSGPAQFYFDLEVRGSRYGKILDVKSQIKYYQSGPQTEVIYNYDLIDWSGVSYNSSLRDVIIRSGRFPEDEYESCVKVINALNGQILTEACGSFSIIYPDPPQLIFPIDGDVITQNYPNFIWNPSIVPPEYQIIHKLKIVERFPHQSPNQAMQANYPHHEAEIYGPGFYNYPLDALPFQEGKEYLWQVLAVDAEGFAPSSNEGKSETWSFFYNSSGQLPGDFPADTLQIQRDYIYLVDISELEINEDLANYVLNGTASIYMKFDGGFSANVPAFVDNLTILKGDLENPTIISGRIWGNVSAYDFPSALLGTNFSPIDFEYTPLTDFTIGGSAVIPGSGQKISLSCRINLSNGNFAGESFLDGAAPLFSIGNDPFQININSAVLRFPSRELTLEGGILLFGSETECGINDLSISSEGQISGNISCNKEIEVALAHSSSAFSLKFGGIEGSFSGELSVSSFDYDLTLAGGFLFKATDKNFAGADLVLRLQPAGLELISFIPRANLDLNEINLGWVKFSLDCLDIESLSYKSGTWDFLIATNLNISFPLFDGITLPNISGVKIFPGGFRIPEFDLQSISLPRINFELFEMEFTRFRVPSMTFDFPSWVDGAPIDLNFDFGFNFRFPNLPSGSDSELRNLVLKFPNVSISNGNFSIDFPNINFGSPGLYLPIMPDISFRITDLFGTIKTTFDGTNYYKIPEIKFNGKFELPPIFECLDKKYLDMLSASLTMNGNGLILGSVENIAPNCPITLGTLKFRVETSTLLFSEERGSQRITLDGLSKLELENKFGSLLNADVALTYEMTQNKLIALSGLINEPFIWNIPDDNPAISFEIQSAEINLHSFMINGRNNLILPGGKRVGSTFDNLCLSWKDYSIISGRIIFDSPFAFEFGLAAPYFSIQAVDKESSFTITSGVKIYLPDEIFVDSSGFRVSGTSIAKLRYQEYDLDSLIAVYSDDFAFSLMPFKIKSGNIQIFRETYRIAIINSDGFFPDPAYFIDKMIPDKLPLPMLAISYLLLREDGDLKIDYSLEGNNVRIKSKQGQKVKHFFPAFAIGEPDTPYVYVEFDLLLDQFTLELRSGDIFALVQKEKHDEFDLSSKGIPFAVREFRYSKFENVYKYRFDGKLKIFNHEISDENNATLWLNNGILTGEIDIAVDKEIPIVEGSDKLLLHTSRAFGTFETHLTGSSLISFDLNLLSAIKMNLGDKKYGANARIGITPFGCEIREFHSDTLLTSGRLDIGWIKLMFDNFGIVKFDYDQTAGWDFEFRLDVGFEFSELGLTIPMIKGITFNRDGFDFPSFTIPEFESAPFHLNGFSLKALAFRMPTFTFDWFNYSPGVSDEWDFSFDFELNLPKLPKVSILDAGYRNGIIFGSIELREFEFPGFDLSLDGFNFFVGKIGGRFELDASTGKQGVSIVLNGGLQLSDIFPCRETIYAMDVDIIFDNSGNLTGRIENVVPTCPLDIGFGLIKVNNSSIALQSSNKSQHAFMDIDGILRLPINSEGDSLTANATIKINLKTGEILDGSVAINDPFILGFPSDDPLFLFSVNSAVLDSSGLKINGGGELLLEGSTAVGVIFNDLIIDINKFKIKSGNINFINPFAFEIGITEGGLLWKTIDINEIPSGETFIKIILPSSIILNSDGLLVDGTSGAYIKWQGTEYNLLDVNFTNNFNVKFNPSRVTRGKADFIMNESIIAFLDSAGFHPGDILGAIPMPEKIPLPNLATAYLKIRDGENLLIETNNAPGGIIISTRPGEKIKLVIPALQFEAAAPPEFDVEFSATINAATFHVVDGSITVASADEEASLLSLKDFGIPLDLSSIKYEKVNGIYSLTASAKLTLPDMLEGLNITIHELSINETGIIADIEAGNYATHYISNLPNINSIQVGENIGFNLKGIRLILNSTNKVVKFSGDIKSALFCSGPDTSWIHYYSEWQSNKFIFALNVSHLEDAKLKIGTSLFKPQAIAPYPAMGIEFIPGDFNLILSGALEIPSFGNEFSLAVAGLKINKSGVSIPQLSLTTPSEYHAFNLFGAEFIIKDIAANKAISFEYINKVLYIILSGEIKFLEQTAQFSGFKIGSNGSLALAYANLLSSPVYIIEDYLALTKLTVDNNALLVNGFARLPEPADTTKREFGFYVSPNGVVSGGSKIIIIDEIPGLGGADNTEYDFWIAKFDPTYAALDLDFADVPNSSFKFIADVYFANNESKRIKIGHKNGSTIMPGLEIKFNGQRNWGNISSSSTIADIDWETLKLQFTNIGSAPASDRFTLSLTGLFNINLPGISGGLRFADLRINSSGEVSRLGESIIGGDLSIIDVVTISVENIEYSSTPSTIIVTEGSKPNAPGDGTTSSEKEINVLSYFRFSGSIDIANVASGGIEEFLVYRTANSKNMIIKKAELSIQNVVSVRTDLIYEMSERGHQFLMAGVGNFVGQSLIVVGKVANLNGKTSFGAFVTASTTIPITPVLLLSGVGGGFFYNPEESDIQLVKNLAGFDSDMSRMIVSDPGRFALFLYASVAVVSDNLAKGRALLTLTQNYFALNGKLTLLNMGNRINGSIYLAIGFQNGFAEGEMNINVDFPIVVNGSAKLGFYVYDADAWGIYGKAEVKILNFINGSAELFVGNPGFMVSVNIKSNFDIWIISVQTGFEGMVWYVRDVSWGAYAKMWINVEVFAGIAAAKGWLEGALIGSPDFYMYGAAGLKIRVICFSWKGSVWGKIKNGSTSGGFGRDSEMDKLIAEAKGTANALEEARDEAINSINSASIPSLTLSAETLSAAFQEIYRIGLNVYHNDPALRHEAITALNTILNSEKEFGKNQIPPTIKAEIYATCKWVVDNIWKSSAAPNVNVRPQLFALRDQIDQEIALHNSELESLAENLSSIITEVEEFALKEYVMLGNPVINLNFASPSSTEYEGQDGIIHKNVTSQPDFTVNLDIANANAALMEEAETDFSNIETVIQEKITSVNNAIVVIDNSLAGESPSPKYLQLGQKYQGLLASTEKLYTDFMKYLVDETKWANATVSLLLTKKSEIESRMSTKTEEIAKVIGYVPGMPELKRLTKWRYETIMRLSRIDESEILSALSSFEMIWDAAENETRKSYATEKGVELWYSMSNTGLGHLFYNSALQAYVDYAQKMPIELERINQPQHVYTNALDEIFTVRAELVENLYDLYNRYYFWKQDQPDSVKNKPLSISSINSKKNEIAEQLKVPVITSLNVINRNLGFLNFGTFQWAFNHTSPKECAFELLSDANSGASPKFKSIGAPQHSQMFRYFLQPSSGITSQQYQFFLRARAGAGYTNARKVVFNAYFENGGDGINSTTVVDMTGDNTPPLTPSVHFPKYRSKTTTQTLPASFQTIATMNGFITVPTTTNETIFYASTPKTLYVEWNSADPESGIIEYQYSIGTTPGSSDALAWTTAQGRTNMLIQGLNLSTNKKYFVNVKSRNGAGKWSAAGSSAPLIIDNTPPSKPTLKNTIESLTTSNATYTNIVVRPVIPLPSDLSKNGSGIVINNKNLSILAPGYGSYIPSVFPGITAAPKAYLSWNRSYDFESEVFEYSYFIYKKSDPSVQTTEWSSLGNVTSAEIKGSPLNYRDSFYILISAVNYAGLPSENLEFGPYQPKDATPPTKPLVNLAINPETLSKYLIFSVLSKDMETGVKGYRIAIGSSPGGSDLRNFPDQIDFYPEEIGTANSWLIPDYEINATKYYITIKAVNNHGLESDICVTGPYDIDQIPPQEPGVSLVLEKINNTNHLKLNFSSVKDLKSLGYRFEYAIQLAKSLEPLQWINAGSLTSLTIQMDKLNLLPNSLYAVKTRIVNKDGIASKVATSTFMAP